MNTNKRFQIIDGVVWTFAEGPTKEHLTRVAESCRTWNSTFLARASINLPALVLFTTTVTQNKPDEVFASAI